MDWTAIGALGELVGATGVILTLLYLARQVRAASIQDQRSRYDATLDMATRWTQTVFEDGEAAEFTLRGLVQGASALTRVERFRFYSGLLNLCRTYERVCEYSVGRGVPGWGKETFDRTFTELFAFPGAREYWAERGHWFSDELRRNVEEILAAPPTRLAASYDESDHREQLSRGPVSDSPPR